MECPANRYYQSTLTPNITPIKTTSQQVPSAWPDISRLYLEEGNEPGKEWAKDALRRYIESGDNSVSKAQVWGSIVEICKTTGDFQGEMQALAELSDSPDISTEELSSLADSINRIFSIAKREGRMPFQQDERKYLVSKLIQKLESRIEYLDSTDLSRLSWLYLNIHDEARALVLARKGQEKDGYNEHCANLVKKLERLAAQ